MKPTTWIKSLWHNKIVEPIYLILNLCTQTNIPAELMAIITWDVLAKFIVHEHWLMDQMQRETTLKILLLLI